MRRNLATSLRGRVRADPMAAFDRLPPPARAFVRQAVLPWSAASVARIWARALAETGCPQAALDRLRAAEARGEAEETCQAGASSGPVRKPEAPLPQPANEADVYEPTLTAREAALASWTLAASGIRAGRRVSDAVVVSAGSGLAWPELSAQSDFAIKTMILRYNSSH